MEKITREYYLGHKNSHRILEEEFGDYAYRNGQVIQGTAGFGSGTENDYCFAGTDIRLNVRDISYGREFDVKAVLAYTVKDSPEDIERVRKTLVEKLGMSPQEE